MAKPSRSALDETDPCDLSDHERSAQSSVASRFTAAHKLEKPNDARALALMDRAAQARTVSSALS